MSVLFTLTAPSASGKSYLLEHIRDVACLPCLISTTTRAPRAGEVEGRDYFFISKEKSEEMEANGEFAELAKFGGNRYGVTKKEFSAKLNSPEGVAFLIVEPEGIDHYVAPALEVGAQHVKIFVDVPLEVRIARLEQRVTKDLANGSVFYDPYKEALSVNKTRIEEIIHSYTIRLQSVLGKELSWKDMHDWDLVLDGRADPVDSVKKILEIAEVLKSVK